MHLPYDHWGKKLDNTLSKSKLCGILLDMIPMDWEKYFWFSQSNVVTTFFSPTLEKLKQIKITKSIGWNPGEESTHKLFNPSWNKVHNRKAKATITHDKSKAGASGKGKKFCKHCNSAGRIHWNNNTMEYQKYHMASKKQGNSTVNA